MRAPLLSNPRWWIGLVAFAACFAPPASGDEPSLAQVFERTAAGRGMDYRIGRDLLVSQGERILPFLGVRTRSDDWRQHALARALVFRLEHVERTREVTRALRWRSGPAQPATDRSGVTFPVRPWNGRSHDPLYEFVLRADDTDLLVDLVREWGIDPNPRSVQAAGAWICVDALALFRAERAVPALVEGYDTSLYGSLDRLHEALGRLGPAASRALVERVRTGPDRRDRASLAERYASAGTTHAAIGLGHLGGEGAAEVLLQRLAGSPTDHLAHACASALLQLGATDAIPLLFERLLSRAQPPGNESHGSEYRGYEDFRSVLVGFGPALVSFLRRRAGTEVPVGERAVATGLLFDLEHAEQAGAFYVALGRREPREDFEGPFSLGERQQDPDALERVGRAAFWRGSHPWNTRPADVHVPVELAIELAWARPDVPNLTRLARLEEPPLARDVVAALLSGPLHRRRAGPVLLALAESRAPGAFDLLSSLVEAEPPPGWLSAMVEATLLLGEPRATAVLRRFVQRAKDTSSPSCMRFRQVQPFAEEALALFERSAGEGLATMLESEHEAVRLAVARILARQGDPAGLEILLDVLASAKRDTYASRRADVLRLGAKALPTIAKRRSGTSDLRMQVLYDALQFRIERPKEARHIDDAVQAALPRVRSRAGPKLGHYRGGGARLAKAAGEDALPILAEYAVAGRRWGEARVALFAIAAQGNPETIPLVVFLAPQDRPLAVEALSMYGAPGIEAAKRIPTPDPAKPAFASRGRRHVAATETLARADEPVALDRVLEGLGEPIPTEIDERRTWRKRMVGYLRIARARTEPHLVEPVVRLLQADSDRSLVQAAFDVLGFIDDDRVVPLCLKHVPAYHYHSDAAMRALVRRLGKEAGPALFARFSAADDEKEKLRFGRALARLRRHGAFGRGIPPHDVEERAEAVAGTEALALEALGSLLSTAGEGVQRKAADELASMWVFEKSREALTLLVPWVDGMADPPGSVVIRLTEGKPEGAGPALLAAYRAGNLERGDVAKALGDLGYEPALPYVIEGLERRLKTLRAGQQRVLEVYALIGLGEAGQHKAATLLDRDLPPPILSHVVLLLGNAGYADAYSPTLRLLRAHLSRPWPDEQEARRHFLRDLNLLAHGVGAMNPAAGRRELTLALLQARDEAVAETLRGALGTLDMRHPHIAPVPTHLK